MRTATKSGGRKAALSRAPIWARRARCIVQSSDAATTLELFPEWRLSPFVGRETELARLEGAWRRPGGLFGLYGGVGVGKSALMRAAIQRLTVDTPPGGAAFERPAHWICVAATAKRGEAPRILNLLWRELYARGLIEKASAGTRETEIDRALQIAAALRRHRLLIVIDGAEHLQHPPHLRGGRFKNAALAALAGALAQATDECSGLLLLVGRQPLREASSTQRMLLAELPQKDGAALLAAQGVVGGAEELRLAASALEGNPLCLKRAARILRRRVGPGGRLRGADVDRIAPEELIRDADGPIDPEVRRAAAALAQDVARVERLPRRAAGRGDPERALLSMISLSRLGLGRPALEALLAPPAIPGLTDTLLNSPPKAREARLAFAARRLCAMGLATRRDGDGDAVYTAPLLVRAVARARLAREAPDALGIAERRLFQVVKAGAVSHPACVSELSPVVAAIGHGAAGARGAGALSKLFRNQLWDRVLRGERRYALARFGAFDAVGGALAAFFEARWTQPSQALEPLEQARALSIAGFALAARARLREAAAAQLAAADLFSELRRPQDAARALTERAEALAQIGDLEAARCAAEDALAQAELAPHLADRQVTALSALAGVEALDDRQPAAARRLREAERIQASLVEAGLSERPRLYSLAGRRAALVKLAEGRIGEAERRAAAMRTAAEEDGYPYALGLAQLTLAQIEASQLQLDPRQAIPAAREAFNRAVTAFQEAGRLDALPEALLARGSFLEELWTLRGGSADRQAAQSDFRRALTLAETAEMTPVSRQAKALLLEQSPPDLGTRWWARR